jgi:protein-S-isoprenylcysteine O-methyltransferase Ste14
MDTEWFVDSISSWLWIAWVAYWWMSAFDVKRSQWRESAAMGASYRLPMIPALLLLLAPKLFPHVVRERFLPPDVGLEILGDVLIAVGLGFSVWARVHLGKNWSGTVTVKENHELIRTGPYRFVRHPIYTGILLAFVGTALEIGQWRALAAIPLAFISFDIKRRIEEGRMMATFADYGDYRKTTAAIVPLVY